MMNNWQKIFSTISYLFGFGLISLVMHEFFHFIVLRLLGGDGYIAFTLLKGYTYFTIPPNPIWIFDLSGGLLTAIFLLVIFWVWPRFTKKSNNVNLEVSSFTWAIGNLIYAIVEVFSASLLIGSIMFSFGFTIAGLIYFIKMREWLMQENG